MRKNGTTGPFSNAIPPSPSLLVLGAYVFLYSKGQKGRVKMDAAQGGRERGESRLVRGFCPDCCHHFCFHPHSPDRQKDRQRDRRHTCGNAPTVKGGKRDWAGK